jgi:hypothetical protein
MLNETSTTFLVGPTEPAQLSRASPEETKIFLEKTRTKTVNSFLVAVSLVCRVRPATVA